MWVSLYNAMVCMIIRWAFEGFEDYQLPDGQIADRAISVLDQLPYRVSAKGKLAWQRLLAVVLSSL